MAEKTWVDVEAFIEAFTKALTQANSRGQLIVPHSRASIAKARQEAAGLVKQN
jgi:hypothetical protein